MKSISEDVQGSYVTFYHALAALGIPEAGLRVQEIDEGTSNIALNINCIGATWAVAIRFPTDSDADRFVDQKLRTVAVAEFLANAFEFGFPLANHGRFVFDGRSFLTNSVSTKDFLHRQARRPALKFVDQIRNVASLETLAPLAIPGKYLTYHGPYFVSKGAPAKETLSDSISFADLMLQGLAALHAQTGATAIPPKEELLAALDDIEQAFFPAADSWQPKPDGKPGKRIEKYNADYGQNKFSKREVFLQQEEGRSLIRELGSLRFVQLTLDPGYRSFTHGDAHGRNFIVVQFDYTVLGKQDHFLDREYLNGLFQEFADLNRVTVQSSESGRMLTYRHFRDGDDGASGCVVVERAKHNDLHLIDPDTGTGINEGDKECYLFDLITLTISIRNWCRLHGARTRDFGDLTEVYMSEFVRQLGLSGKEGLRHEGNALRENGW